MFVQLSGASGDQPSCLIFLMSKEIGPFGRPEADGSLHSFSHASGTMCRRSGFCANFLTHPPMTFAVRYRSGSSQDFGATMAKVASGALLAVVPP
eukprot:333537-Heterocapsa_arctica.AAC.1